MKNGLKLKDTQFVSELGDVLTNGFAFVKEAFDAPYNTHLGERMKEAYEINVRRAARLHQIYASGDRTARNAVEAYVTGHAQFNSPPSELADGEDRIAANYVRETELMVDKAWRSGKMPKAVAVEFLHTISDFPNLTQACVQRSLQNLSEEGICSDDCLSRVFYNKGAIDPCSVTGRLGLIPVKSSGNSGCPHTHDEECDCAPAKWKFGETTRGDFGVGIFKDEISVSWWLRQCALYGGWDQELLSWILRIKNERKESLRASLLGDASGYNDDIFNVENDNILEAGGCINPAIGCTVDAIQVLESFNRRNAYKRDNDGLLVCSDREYILISGDWDIVEYTKKALTASIETVHTLSTDVEDCENEIRTVADGSFSNISACYSPRLREVLGDAGANGKYFILPVAEQSSTGRNFGEEATMTGLENVRFVRKHPMYVSMTGSPLVELGSDICFNDVIMALDSYGAGHIYPELGYASDGTCTPIPEQRVVEIKTEKVSKEEVSKESVKTDAE